MIKVLGFWFGSLFLLVFHASIYCQYTTSSAGGEWTNDAYWGGNAPPYNNVEDDVTVSHRTNSNFYPNSSIQNY